MFLVRSRRFRPFILGFLVGGFGIYLLLSGLMALRGKLGLMQPSRFTSETPVQEPVHAQTPGGIRKIYTAMERMQIRHATINVPD